MTDLRLRDYQRFAIDHLHRNPRAGLFLDMGLGKTASVLSALTPEHLPALVVAPKRVAENVWSEERDLWRPDLDLRVAAGSPAKRSKALMEPADIHVIGRDNFADVIPHRMRYRTMIIDESSGFKSWQSQRWKTAKSLLVKDGPFRYVWEMTGTPSPNGYLDLWAPMYLLDWGERLYSGIGKYRTRYFTPRNPLPNGIIPGWDPRPGAQTRINELISDICMSMQSDGRIELPEFTVNPVRVNLPPAAKQAYRDMDRTFVADLELLGGGIHSASTAATLSNKLSQISAGFIYREDGGYDVVHREKIEALREIIDGTGSPVLVFYRYKSEAEEILKAIPNVSTVEEDDWYQRWNSGQIPVLLAHPASIGHGLNLQRGGHTAVWTTPDWNLEQWDQGNKRLHRSGQKNNVVSHVLIASKIDRLVLRRVADKLSVQEALMEYLESPL